MQSIFEKVDILECQIISGPCLGLTKSSVSAIFANSTSAESYGSLKGSTLRGVTNIIVVKERMAL